MLFLHADSQIIFKFEIILTLLPLKIYVQMIGVEGEV